MKIALRYKLTFSLVTLLSLIIGTFTALSFYFVTNILLDNYRKNLKILDTNLAKQVDFWIENNFNALKNYALKTELSELLQHPELEDLSAEVNQYLYTLMNNGRYSHVLLLNEAGSVVASANDAFLNKNYRHTFFFQRALQQLNFVYENIEKLEESEKEAEAIFTVQIFDKNAKLKPIGILVVAIPFEKLSSELYERGQLGKGGFMFMISSDGVILMHRDKNILMSSVYQFDFGTRLVELRQGALEYNYHGNEIMSYITPIESTGWLIGLRSDKTELLKSLYNFYIWLISLTAIFFILAVASIYFLTGFIKPLVAVKQRLVLLAQGQAHSQTSIKYHANDEIKDLIIATEQLQDSLKATIETAQAVAQGNYQQNIQIRSEKDQLNKAIAEMTRALNKTTEQMREQDWLKTGQALLASELGGEQTVLILGQNILHFLSAYLNAPIGSLYLLKEHVSPPMLELVGCTCMMNELKQTEFAIGEGFIGEVAAAQRIRILRDIPEDYCYLQSGLGGCVPVAIILIPIAHDGELKGVIELATLNHFSALVIKFIEQIIPSIGIALHAAQIREYKQTLINESAT